MIVCISQPRYLPFLGYFHRMAGCDLWIHLDTVQYSPRDWENRNKIKTPQGWAWLTVPVHARYQAMIPEVKINYEHPWQHKHWETIKACYQGTGFFRNYESSLSRFYGAQTWELLKDLNIESTGTLCELLGMKTPQIVLASTLKTEAKGSQLILNLCREVGASAYLSGAEGRSYLDSQAFQAAGIQLQMQDYKHPVYPQQFGPFEPFMAIIDLLCNCGPKSLEILKKDQTLINL
jgi:hypothetical protein